MTNSNDLKWLKVQALSGAVFAGFLFMHLFNTMLAAAGPGTYDAVQGQLRRGYQAPVLEVVLVLGPLLLHVGTAVARMWKRPKAAPLAMSWRARLHRWSGRFLLVFFVGHVVATRGSSLVYGVFPGFEGLAFTFRWVPAYFWPYYLLLALSGWYHLVHGLSVALPLFGVRVLQRRAVFLCLVSVGSIALVVGVLSLGGVFFDVGDPSSSPYARLVLRLSSGAPSP